MDRSKVFSGIPPALAADAWWLGAAPPVPPHVPCEDPKTPGRRGVLLPLGLGLVLLADLFFWGRAAGVSLPIYAAALFFVATFGLPPARLLGPSGVLLLGALPSVEYVQPLSVAILVLAFLVALAWARRPALTGHRLALAALRLALAVPRVWRRAVVWPIAVVREGGAALPALRRETLGVLRNWAFPIGGALVFGGLILSANPILADLIPSLDPIATVDRLLFWAGIAVLIWPFLTAAPPEDKDLPGVALRAPSLGLNTGSVLRALWVFNGLIGVQSVLDLSILLGGAALPEGMSYAEYAHRGAYPLLATALLAGAFALAARPFLAENRLLRPLLMLWLLQNMALCGAALLRLDLYVEVYGLTYLRVHAMIWMALVALGLGLTAWQILARKPNSWLMLRCMVLGAVTLYAASFVNFAKIIADHNLALPDPDYAYLCRLGPMTGLVFPTPDVTQSTREPLYCFTQPPQIDSWPEWGFRPARVARYAATAAPLEAQ